ncbi:MAG: hypothetical protein AAGF66_07435 [Cyanobacteria bacterium P01_H01_bin.119]
MRQIAFTPTTPAIPGAVSNLTQTIAMTQDTARSPQLLTRD